MSFSTLRSPHAIPTNHQDRGLTLIFGSDGQVSLFGFDSGIASQVPYTLTASNIGALTPGTPLRSQPTSVSLIPNLEATTGPLTGTSSSAFGPTPTLTSSSTLPSSLASSSYDPSSTTTDTNTYLPSIPTVNYPTPSPTPVSTSKNRDVGAPFYLAVVLASISFVGCIAAFIAWWIRSRTRRRALDFDDPWNHGDTISDNGSPFTENVNAFDKRAPPKEEPKTQTQTQTQTQPYYLPASIVRRISSNLLAVPHAAPANDPSSQNMATEPNSYQTSNLYSRPGMEHVQTGLSVQESTRTLGRLHVANRVPGDVTSGDEGAMSVPRLQNGAGLSSAGRPNTTPVGESVMQNPYSDQSGRAAREDDIPLEPPGPATLSWGKRTDTIAALRRTGRRTPGTTLQAHENASHGRYLYPKQDGEPSGIMPQAPATAGLAENGKVQASVPSDPLGWKSTLKSSFWQAVDAMTGNRPADLEPTAANGGGGSRFTPAPQRIASRHSPVSPIRPATGFTLPYTQSQARYDLTLPTKHVNVHAVPQNSGHSNYVGSSARRRELGLPLPPSMPHLNSNIGASTHRRHPDSLRIDTGSMYSTESAAARANLRKYGYADSIPSTWSALGAARESQLNLGPIFLPLPMPICSSPRPLSVTSSQLTLESGLLSSSVNTRTRTCTPVYSESDLIGSDVSILQYGKHSGIASHGETASFGDSMSRNGTIQSGRSTVGHGTGSSLPSSATSSMLTRKKGVTTRRKRPRLPQRAPSSASSVQTLESGLSVREVAVRRALLERRRKVKGVERLRDRDDTPTRDTSATVFE